MCSKDRVAKTRRENVQEVYSKLLLLLSPAIFKSQDQTFPKSFVEVCTYTQTHTLTRTNANVYFELQ